MKSMLFSALAVISTATAWAQNPTFKVTADIDTVALDEFVMLTVTMTNCDPNTFKLPELAGFSLAGRPSTQSSMMMMNGKITSSATHTYHLLPTKSGKYTLDKLTVQTNDGKTLKADKIKLVVLDKYRDPEAKNRFRQDNRQPTAPEQAQPRENPYKPKRKTIQI